MSPYLFTRGDLFGALLLGMGLGLLVFGIGLSVWLDLSGHLTDPRPRRRPATRRPQPQIHRHRAPARMPAQRTEAPTERVTHQPHDLPRRGSLIDRSL